MQKLLFILCFFCSVFVFSQQKFEKEYRIKLEDAPKKSIEFIQRLNFKKKIKWYAEESNDGKTFEAKTCHLNNLYSIEFSEKGTLIDVEKKVSLSDLDKTIQQKLKNSLSKEFVKFRFKKVQIQYKGLENEVKNVFLNTPREALKTKIFYEIVIKAKKNKDYNLYEALFDEQGNLIKLLTFKEINSINLEF